jgi:alpha-beta hydrolase superfamily lysophospholipase
MPWYQRSLLWIAAHTVPGKKLTGEGLDIQPSDNIEMLRELGRDPLVIKETRVDALYGIANLMDQAAEQTGIFNEPALIMYGKHDQIVPRAPTCKWIQSLDDIESKHQTIVLYENGYHMLNRGLNADEVLTDISSWIIGSVEDSSEKLMPDRNHLESANTAVLAKFCNH